MAESIRDAVGNLNCKQKHEVFFFVKLKLQFNFIRKIFANTTQENGLL